MPASICWDLIRLLKVLHDEAGVAHRDVKPDNIVVNDDYVPKFVDFELSVKDATKTTKGVDDVGTPGWKAPEVQRGEHLLFAADIWAMGKVLKLVLNSGALRPDETIDVVNSIVGKFQADDPQERLQALDSFQDFATFAAQTVDTKIEIAKEQDESLLVAKTANNLFAARTVNTSLSPVNTAKASRKGTRRTHSWRRPVYCVARASRLVQTIFSIGKALVTGR
jgi:serine/threonine protein kinase